MRIKRTGKKLLKTELSSWQNYLDTHRISNLKASTLAHNSCNIMESIVDYGDREDTDVRAVFVEDKLQGAIGYESYGDHYRIAYIAVAPWNVLGMKKRNKYCGAALIRYVFKKALKQSKIKYVDLIAHSDAVEFYKKLGFTSDGTGMKITRRKIYEQFK